MPRAGADKGKSIQMTRQRKLLPNHAHTVGQFRSRFCNVPLKCKGTLSLVVAAFAVCQTVVAYTEDAPVNPSRTSAASGLATVSPSDAEVFYYGVWVQVPAKAAPDRRRTNEPFAACQIAFRGTHVRWLGAKGPDHGHAAVYLDGRLAETIDAYAPAPQAAQVLFEAKDLEDDRIHTLRIVVRPERHADAVDCSQGIDGFEVGEVVDFYREYRAKAMDELKTIATGEKAYLAPDQWKPVPYAAEAPETGVQLQPGVLRDAFDRNIAYILDTVEEPCASFWVDALPASSEGRLLGAAANTLRWEEREDLRNIVDEVVEIVKQRQDPDGYCLPYDRRYMDSNLIGFMDERRNYDRVNLTRGMVAAGRAGNKDALPIMRRFYDWLNPSPQYRNSLMGSHDGSGHNCNNGHEGGLLMYLSPVGKPEDLVAVERYFVQDFFIDQMRNAEPLALSQYALSKPHSYLLLSFKAWLDHYRATGAQKYLEAAQGAWEVVNRDYEHIGGTIAICEGHMVGLYPPQSYFITPSPILHTGETCGSVFWADINHRLLQFFPGNETYAAEIEKSIYNVILAVQDENGYIRYHSPLLGRKEAAKRINTCCEVMGTPFIASLPQFIYSIDPEGLWVNLYAASDIAWTHEGKDLQLKTATKFPYDGKVTFTLKAPSETSMAIRIRIPSWTAQPVTVKVNRKPAAEGAPGTYVELSRTWKDGDRVTMTLPMDFSLTQYTGLDQAPRQSWDKPTAAPRNRYALSYGPLLMALTGATDIDLTPEGLLAALSPVKGAPLHFTVRGNRDCRFQPYWTLGREQMTCLPTLNTPSKDRVLLHPAPGAEQKEGLTQAA